jgi:hypothetical protein
MHTDIKVEKNPISHVQYDDANNLIDHVENHVPKEFSCIYCHKKFPTSRGWKIHTKKIHLKKDKLPTSRVVKKIHIKQEIPINKIKKEIPTDVTIENPTDMTRMEKQTDAAENKSTTDLTKMDMIKKEKP